MIVRDEAEVIESCLRSVVHLVDSWVIADTGSTDATREKVRAVLGDVPGELHDSLWVDFAHSRTEVMQKAKGRADYLLLIDADMTLHQQAPLPQLDADAYLLRATGGGDGEALRLVGGNRRWWFEGAAHDYIASAEPFSRVVLEELRCEHHADPSTRPRRLMRDADLLERELARDPGNARSTFYLAQTYRELGHADLALDYYRKRVAMGGSDEEVFYARLQEGLLQAADDADAAIPILLDAWQRRPSRAEPLFELARLCRERGDLVAAQMFANRGLEVPYPPDSLFVDHGVYRWGLLLQRAIAAAGIGQRAQALEDLRAIRGQSGLPERVAGFVQERLAELDAKSDLPGRRRADHEDERLSSLVSSARLGEVRLDVEPKWPVRNPSIANEGSGFRMIVPTAEAGLFPTVNYLVSLDGDLMATAIEPITAHPGGPPEAYEDWRPIEIGEKWYATAKSHLRGPVLLAFDDASVVETRQLFPPDPSISRGSFAPLEIDGGLHLLCCFASTIVASVDPATGATELLSWRDAPQLAGTFRVGSQGLAVEEGHLFVVHEVDGDSQQALAHHRFVLLDRDLRLAACSPRFKFTSAPWELCSGIARRNGEIVLSFGVADVAAGIAVVPAEEVLSLLDPSELHS